jgi:hypothetical protein
VAGENGLKNDPIENGPIQCFLVHEVHLPLLTQMLYYRTQLTPVRYSSVRALSGGGGGSGERLDNAVLDGDGQSISPPWLLAGDCVRCAQTMPCTCVHLPLHQRKEGLQSGASWFV